VTDFNPTTPAELLELDLSTLLGRTEAEARQLVEAASGSLRATAPNQAVTLDYRPERVTIVVVDDRVVSVQGIG
jgi:hypothetical protein